MKKIKILLTDGENKKAISILRAIGNTAEVYTCSKFGNVVLSSFSIFGNKNFFVRNYQEDLLQLIDKIRPDFLLSSQENTIIEIDKIYKIIEQKGIIILFRNLSDSQIFFDKKQTLNKAKEYNINVPKTIFAKDADISISDIEKSIGYPCIIKAQKSINKSERGNIKSPVPTYIQNESQLVNAIRSYKELGIYFMVQEYVSGVGVGIFYLSNSKGQITIKFAHERVLDVIPTGSASCLRKSVMIPGELDDKLEKLLKNIDWTGPSMFEFKKTSDNRFVLMEVNGRYWGSLELATRAGVNFLQAQIDNITYLNSSNDYKRAYYLLWEIGMFKRFVNIIKGKPKGFQGYYPSIFEGLMEFKYFFKSKINYEIMTLNDPFVIFGEIYMNLLKVFRR